MTLNISVPTSTQELRPKITVIGVGGAGGNAVNNMITANLEGVEFLVANTDGQALAGSLAPRKIQLGRNQTQGLGAGSQPEVGRIAAEESLDDILAELADSHMVFITAGMGGGTGTGAAPIIAKAARERGILTVGVVTKPFDFEGQKRMTQAATGIEELQAYVDTLIIIPNQNLFRLANERTTFADAFAMADEVLHKGVCGVTDLMIKPGNINLDFADIRTVMSEMGKAMMGTGEASGENRAANAAEAAINNPLLDETNMKGAQAVLINITGGSDMTLFEVDEAANHIRREVDSDATIIFGSALDEKMEGIMRVSVVATGMEAVPNSMIQTGQATVTATITPQHLDSPVDIETLVDEQETDKDVVLESMADEDVIPEQDIPEQDITQTTPFAMSTPASDEDDTIPDLDLSSDEDDITDAEDAEAMTTEAEAEAEAKTETETEDDAAEAQPFMLRQTIDIPEDTPKAEAVEGPKSLIGHLSRMMFASKSPPENNPENNTKIDAEPTAAMLNIEVEANLEDTVAIEDETAASAETPLMQDPPVEDQEEAPSGIAALKPTTQPQLDIVKAGEDVDLDIPAFLRRQAN
ncbi:MAG: cell division protein FtsZ [Candidatus Puniceispirillales bacterium WSBS_2018_MAG_OTU23]